MSASDIQRGRCLFCLKVTNSLEDYFGARQVDKFTESWGGFVGGNFQELDSEGFGICSTCYPDCERFARCYREWKQTENWMDTLLKSLMSNVKQPDEQNKTDEKCVKLTQLRDDLVRKTIARLGLPPLPLPPSMPVISLRPDIDIKSENVASLETRNNSPDSKQDAAVANVDASKPGILPDSEIKMEVTDDQQAASGDNQERQSTQPQKPSLAPVSLGLSLGQPVKNTAVQKLKALDEKILKHRREIEIATAALNLECGHCGKKFKSRKSLQTHVRGQHEQSLKCIKCGKQYKRSDMLQNHVDKCKS